MLYSNKGKLMSTQAFEELSAKLGLNVQAMNENWEQLVEDAVHGYSEPRWQLVTSSIVTRQGPLQVQNLYSPCFRVEVAPILADYQVWVSPYKEGDAQCVQVTLRRTEAESGTLVLIVQLEWHKESVLEILQLKGGSSPTQAFGTNVRIVYYILEALVKLTTE